MATMVALFRFETTKHFNSPGIASSDIILMFIPDGELKTMNHLFAVVQYQAPVTSADFDGVQTEIQETSSRNKTSE